MRDGLVMLTRRAREPQAGWWDLPGGFLEPGEHPEAALIREVREELGVDYTPGPLITEVDWQYPDKRVRIIAGLGEVGWDKAAAAAGPP